MENNITLDDLAEKIKEKISDSEKLKEENENLKKEIETLKEKLESSQKLNRKLEQKDNDFDSALSKLLNLKVVKE